MRVTRLKVQDFRGWASLELVPREHVVLAGVPRSGRSDIIAALRRVLDPASTRATARLHDLRQWSSGDAAASTESGGKSAPKEVEVEVDASGLADVGGHAESDAPEPDANGTVQRATDCLIEVTLADLDPEVHQLLEGLLEPLDEHGSTVEDEAPPDAMFGVRLAYRLAYDAETDLLEHLVYFPVTSNPATGQYHRVPAAIRRALPVVVVQPGLPLQLRSDGALRQILDERDPTEALAAFDRLADAVGQATSALGAEPAVADAVQAVLDAASLGEQLGDTNTTADAVGFAAEDGSLSALLRSLQPTLRLDQAGNLPLPSHGSTVSAVLSSAEAILRAQVPGAVVLADDFGDHLDAATAEHLASILRRKSGQLWLATRRPEAVRAFSPAELVRLTRHEGQRAFHQLVGPSDKKDLIALRQLQTQLLAALTSPTVVITEGPHDVTTLEHADRYRRATVRMAARGVRVVAAGTGGDGGIAQIPPVAKLARQLGFRVIALVDGDNATAQTDAELQAVAAASDVVLRLPDGVAIEKAMLLGFDPPVLRVASASVTQLGFTDPLVGVPDNKCLITLIKALHKNGYHEQILASLREEANTPPLIRTLLTQIGKTSEPSIGPQGHIVQIDAPEPTEASA